MPCKVIICDDIQVTANVVKKAIEAIGGVTAIWIDHPDRVFETLDKNPDASMLLMDLEFPKRDREDELEVIGHLVLPNVRKRFPALKIVVITHIDAGTAYNVVVETSRSRLHDDWIDIGKILKEDEIRARVEPLLFPLGSVSREGLWLLHLSDLHFGNSERFEFWGLAEDGALERALLKDIANVFAEECPSFNGIDLAVVTGDLSDRARDAEYAKCTTLLKALRRSLSKPLRGATGSRSSNAELVVIPGNHDVNWDISRARCVATAGKTGGYKYCEVSRAEEIDPDLRYLSSYVWAPFRKFIEAVGPTPPSYDGRWNLESHFAGALWELPELGATVIGLNASAHGVDHIDANPSISGDLVRCLAQQLPPSTLDARHLPRIVATHHSLGSTESGVDRMNDSEIGAVREALFEDLNATIFLTGHVHRQVCEQISVGTTSLLFVGAGSSSVERTELPRLSPLHFNLINIHPADAQGRGPVVTVYSRILIDGKFRKHDVRSYEWRGASGWVYLAP